MNPSETSPTAQPEPTSPAPAGSETPPVTPEAELAAATAVWQEQVAAAKKEAADNYDRYVRAVADMDNFRRRTVREKEEIVARANARILEDLIPALDNLSLGIAAAKAPQADLKVLLGGIEMVAGQLQQSLATHGLKLVQPLGQPFDPNLHEAISQQASADIAEGSVTTVVRTGYTLNGRLLRAASVIVSTGPAAAQ